MKKRLLEIQNKLVANARPSGFEKHCTEVIRKLAEPYVDEFITDSMYNLIAHKKGTGKKVMFVAHTDVLGFMVSKIDEEGFLKIKPLGYHGEPFLPGTAVRFINGIKGVVFTENCEGILSGKVGDSTIDNMFIDIGACSREDAEKMVRIGDVCVFEGMPCNVADGRMMGPYFDDLIGCTELLVAMQKLRDTDNDLYFVFTPQEEVGIRGSEAATWTVNPDIGIAVDVFPTSDDLSSSEPTDETELGKGPGLMLMDGCTICTPALVAKIEETAARQDIVTQKYVMLRGGSDAASIQRCRGGVSAAQIDVAQRHPHSPSEMIEFKDVEAVVKLIVALCQEL